MTEFISVDAGLAASAGGGILGTFAWLTSKLWSLLRHETNDMKNAITVNAGAIQKSIDKFSEHAERDEEIHRTMIAELREMKGYLRGQNEPAAKQSKR